MLDQLPFYEQWPHIKSSIAKDPEIEKEVSRILNLMTLDEKIGQMVQVDLYEVTPEEAQRYKFGALLNGAGVWPQNNKRCSAKQWAETIDEYWLALERAYKDRPFHIPLIWGTDAVHGNNNAFEATIFPHNIALGAARDPELIRKIGRVTAKEIAAIGMDWTFAPAVAVSRNSRWGRYYEGFSDDPEIVYSYAKRMVEGLQGDINDLRKDDRVLSCIKHWVGDGGTKDGIDRGVNFCEEDVLRNLHAPGYFSGLAAGAQVVMVSFSAWGHTGNYDHEPKNQKGYNKKMHGSRYLITDVLKDKMGFDGFVLTDWDGHSEVTACELDDACYSINAGVDMLMMGARKDWRVLIPKTIQQVRDGLISQSRIDDAVSRILRVKLRAGIFDKPQPSQRSLSGKQEVLGAPEHLEIAREAVRKSLVLLKNKNNVLPLRKNIKILVLGEAANDICRQTGAWTLDWQGTNNSLEDLPKSVTILRAIEEAVGKSNVHYAACSDEVDLSAFDKVIFVTGEDAYAEMRGDIKPWRRIAFGELKKHYSEESKRLKALANQDIEVVTLFLCGRPLYTSPEISASDAFVIVWLPGIRGDGITDVLFRDESGDIHHDFQGRLPCSWPKKAYDTAASRRPIHFDEFKTPDFERDPVTSDSILFPHGYGLSYQANGDQSATPYDLDNLPEDPILPPSPITPPEQPIRHIYGIDADSSRYVMRMAGRSNWMGLDISNVDEFFQIAGNSTLIDSKGKKDALSVECKGESILIYAKNVHGTTEDLRGYEKIDYQVRLQSYPTEPVFLALHTDYPSQPALSITGIFRALPLGVWHTLSIELSEFEKLGYDFEHIESPFMLYTEGKMDIDVGEISWSVGQPLEN